MYYAYIVIDKDAKDIYKAILNEHITSRMDRTRCDMKLKNDRLILKIYGRDKTSFISTISSYLRWIKVYYDILESIKKE